MVNGIPTQEAVKELAKARSQVNARLKGRKYSRFLQTAINSEIQRVQTALDEDPSPETLIEAQELIESIGRVLAQ